MFLKQGLASEMYKEHYWYLEFEAILDKVAPRMERFGFLGQKMLRTAYCFSGWPGGFESSEYPNAESKLGEKNSDSLILRHRGCLMNRIDGEMTIVDGSPADANMNIYAHSRCNKP